MSEQQRDTTQQLVSSVTASGRTPAKADVSPTGGFTYDLPIWMPPAVGELSLPLSVKYDHRHGNGILGMGWVLSGLSSISRCPSTYAVGGRPAAVTNTKADRFCLDNQPLKLTGGLQGDHLSTYATELESFARIQALGQTGQGPSSFTLTSKNGFIYTFGTNGAVVSNGVTIREWLLSEVADRAGNRIKVSWAVSIGVPRVTAIHYPFTASGAGPFYTVSFAYTLRPHTDIRVGYSAGSYVVDDSLLSGIEVRQATGEVLRRYQFTYQQGAVTKRHQLTAIQECGATTCRQPTTFTYDQGGAAFDVGSPILGANRNGGTNACGGHIADLNGDGRDDFLYSVGATPLTNPPLCEWRVRFSTGTGFTADQLVTYSAMEPFVYGPDPDGSPAPHVLSGQFTGKGRRQLLMPVYEPGANTPSYRVFDYNPSTRTFSSVATTVPAVSYEYIQLAADMNGDGLDDLVSAYSWPIMAGSLFVRINTTIPGGPATFGAPAAVMSIGLGEVFGYFAAFSGGGFGKDAGNFQALDINGDGVRDLVVSYTSMADLTLQFRLLMSNGADGTTMRPMTMLAPRHSMRFPFGYPVTPVTPIDWNGDGCSDYIFAQSLNISRCDGSFVTSSFVLPHPITTSTRPMIGDFNADGRQDIIYIPMDQGAALYATELQAVLSTGVSGVGPINTGVVAPVIGNVTPGYRFYSEAVGFSLLDFDGDGQLDLAENTNGDVDSLNGFPRVYRHLGGGTARPPADVIIKATDGLGMGLVPSYSPLNATGHVPGSSAVFPEQDINPALSVVTRVQTDDGKGGTYQQTYSYFGARGHVQGRGFEGFTQRTLADSRNGLSVVDQYLQTFPFTGMQIASTVRRILVSPTGGLPQPRPIRGWTGVAGVQTLGAGPEQRSFRFLQSQTSNTYEALPLPMLGGKNSVRTSTETTTFTYGDGYGNVTLATTTLTDTDTTAPASPFANLMWTKTETTSYLNDVSSWCLGKPVTKTTQLAAPGALSRTLTSRTTVDATRCRATQELVQPSNPSLSTIKDFSYDPCGNVSTLTVTGRDANGALMTPRTTRWSYGTRCQFPESHTNAAGESVTATYDPRTGLPATKTDANVRTSRWDYDEYARPVREWRPDGTRTDILYESYAFGAWAPDTRQRVARTTYSSLGELATHADVLLDGFDRVRYQRSRHPSGVLNDDRTIEYDQLGRISKEFLPRGTSAALNGYRVFGYDSLDRVVSLTLYKPDGTVAEASTITYLGDTRQLRDALGNTKTEVRDAAGKLRQLIDPLPGGTTQYVYDALGKVAQITDATGRVSTFTHNDLGYLTSTSDANRGAVSNGVNTLGEVTRTTNQKGQVVTFTYDAQGRLIERFEPEGRTTWSFGSSAALRNVGLPTLVSSPGYQETISYDALARPQARSITTDQSYTYSYTYNSIGLLDTITYPTSPAPSPARFALKHSYAFGRLTQLTDVTGAPQTLWRLVAENDYGSVSSHVIGRTTPITVNRDHVQWTNRQNTIRAGSGPSTTDLLNLEYAWDANQNLRSRRDVARGLVEDFIHDPLGRLTSSRINGLADLSVGYDAVGNITWRSDVGTYSYGDPAHPHAVTSAGAVSLSYDANGNVVTRNGAGQSWASFDRPTLLQANSFSTTFAYGPDREVIRQVATTSNGVETTHRIGGLLERVLPAGGGGEQWRHHVPTPSGERLLVTRSSAGTKTTSVLVDHLGSPAVLVDDATGAVLASERFSPFGARRNPATASGPPVAADTVVFANTSHLGFTAHEQLDNVGLVDMRGRVYDPTIGRFLSVDPAKRLEDSQLLNGYAYVANRPLRAIDPTGNEYEVDLLHFDTFDGSSVAIGPGVSVETSAEKITFTITGCHSCLDDTTDAMSDIFSSKNLWDSFIGFRDGFAARRDGSVLDVAPSRWQTPGFSVGFGLKVRLNSLAQLYSELGFDCGGAAPALCAMAGPFIKLTRDVGAAVGRDLNILIETERRTIYFHASTHPRGDTVLMDDIGLFDALSGKGFVPTAEGVREIRALRNELCGFACENGFSRLHIDYVRAGKELDGTSRHPGYEFNGVFDAVTRRRIKE